MSENMGKRISDLRHKRKLTLEQVATVVGVGKSTVRKWETGMIANMKRDKIAKLAEALGTTPAYLMGWKNDDSINISTEKKHSGVRINVLGRVAAGVPIEAQEEIIDWEEISEEMAATGQFFALQIHGDSMLPRIQDGDVVIVRQQPDIDSGDVAIVMVNGSDATCKRVAKYSDGIRLIPNNPSYEPVFYSNEEIESKPVKVIGKVVELRGKF